MKTSIIDKFRKDLTEEERKKFFLKIFCAVTIGIFFTGISFFTVLNNKFRKAGPEMWIISGASDILSNTSVAESASQTIYSNPDEIVDKSFPVYIVGAINNPGIYEIESPEYLYILIDRAGGFTDLADKERINLAFHICESMMIMIPSRIDDKIDDTGGYSVDLYIEGWTKTDTKLNNETKKVNINTSNGDELSTLPGVGEATAKLIIDFRTGNGPFLVIEDIMKVPGIKENKFNKIKEYITVG